MPKSSKKRKDKAADFSKAKLKLGKGKQVAKNAIDTSFKARSISLATQSIAVEKDQNAPTTKRRLTFDDLLLHLKHYNAGTRRDAIFGMRELVELHPQLLASSLTALLNASVRLIGDEDASVRKTILMFFTWLLPRIPTEDLIPHSPLLILFTSSAQTHIFPEIRIDAVRFLDLFLECIPQTVVAGWSDAGSSHGSRVLGGYLGILNAGTKFGEAEGSVTATSSASVTLSAGSQLVVLKSLSTFLQVASSSTHEISFTPSTWYLAPSFTNPEAYQAFDRLLRPCSSSQSVRRWQPDADLDGVWEDFVDPYDLVSESYYTPCTLEKLSDVNCSIDRDAAHFNTPNVLMNLARTLQSTLVSTFLDSAPAVFAPGANPPETETQLALAVGEIVRSLYNAILQGSSSGENEAACENLQAILGYMMPYFPFTPQNIIGRADMKVETAFQRLNIIFCELSSLLALVTSSTPDGPQRAAGGKARRTSTSNPAPKSALSLQIKLVCQYAVRLLNGEAVTSQLGRTLTPQAYITLLSTIWSLLNTSVHGSSSPTLQAVLEHGIGTSSSAALKLPTIEFLGRIALLETEPSHYRGFKVEAESEEGRKFQEWICHLPKTLWELGSNNLPATETILRLLLRLKLRKSRLIDGDTHASIQSRLVPYFRVVHPTRGELSGPYAKLPPQLRRLALDVVAVFSATPPRAVGRNVELEKAVGKAVEGSLEEGYWDCVRAAYS